MARGYFILGTIYLQELKLSLYVKCIDFYYKIKIPFTLSDINV